MNIVFVTNGNTNIGFGHISRTMMLYSFFKKNNFFAKIIVPESCSFPVNEDFIIVKSLAEKDLSFISRDFDIVVIDSIEDDYDNLSWIRNTKLFVVSITLFLFDFSKRYEHISFFPSIRESKIITIGRTQIYTGNKYLTFREDFGNNDFIIREKGEKVLITMGGTDPFGLSLKVVKALAKDESLHITILLSEKADYYNELSDFSKMYPNVLLIGFTDNMLALLKNNDIAIINGGLTRYETCIVGIPFIALSIHQKQFEITQELVDLGVGINLGIYNEISDEQIFNSAKSLLNNKELRRKTSIKMKKLFDTKGVERIYNIICEKFQEHETNNKMV